MDYKDSTKIIFNKRKLDILIRLGCPDKPLLEILKTGKFTKTGDKLIDETLESLVDFKCFKNWGGNHNPKGINGCNKTKKLGQVDLQVDQQVDRSRFGQVEDRDRDINKYLLEFKEFIREYPREVNNNKYNLNYFIEALKKVSFDKLIEQVRNYSSKVEYEGREKQYIKTAENWLKEECWKNNYDFEYLPVEWHDE